MTLISTTGKPMYQENYVRELCGKNSSKGILTNLASQSGPQQAALQSGADILITGGNRGGGKANTIDTPVATPNGMRKIGDLKVGDKICTPWEGTQEVTAIYDQGEQKYYRITFDDGSACTIMDNHRFWARRAGDADFHEMTFREIANDYVIDSGLKSPLRATSKGYTEIPLPPPIDFQNGITIEDLPVHPYVMGILCSSDTFHRTRLGMELRRSFRALAAALYKFGYKLRFIRGREKYYASGLPEDFLDTITRSSRPVPAFVPDIYMKADIESRIAFMQGLFCINPHFYNGHLYIPLKNRALAEQIAQMGRSLGWWVGVDYVPLYRKENEKAWRVIIIAPDDHLPGRYVYSHRKDGFLINAQVPTSKNDVFGLTKKIVRITKREKKECRCITISGNDHLYMTDGYTINHNTFTLLMDTLYDIDKSRFNAIIFRKEKDDLGNIIRDSNTVFKNEGTYNRSKDDMTWYFNSGATLELTYYNQGLEDFKDRFQGRQYSYIGIDEITQIDYDKFKYLITTNRNAAGIKNRVIGTCNPNPVSWVRDFIDWWIGDDGYPIKERDGIIRYCYMTGNDVNETVWGDSREEVYEKCKDDIDLLWEKTWGDDEPPADYTPQRMFTKAVTFIRAELKYNRVLINSDKSYFANLAQQSEEQKARDLMGNWNFMTLGDDIIKMADLQACFDNAQQVGDNIKRVSCDVAFTGGDQCVMWLWVGWHVQDIFVCKLNAKDTVGVVKAKLVEWGVTENHFTYDLNGLGQTFKGFFPHAVPFNNLEAVKPRFKNVYDNVKSQCAYEFAQKVLEREISFNPSILTRKFSGKGYKNRMLKEVLQIERKCIRQDTDKMDKGWCLIKKAQMKNLVGHSPDFFEALLMRMIFEVKHSVVEIPQWVNNF